MVACPALLFFIFSRRAFDWYAQVIFWQQFNEFDKFEFFFSERLDEGIAGMIDWSSFLDKHALFAQGVLMMFFEICFVRPVRARGRLGRTFDCQHLLNEK